MQNNEKEEILGAIKTLGDRVETLGNRVETLGDRVETLGNRVETLGDRVDVLNGRVETLSEHVEVLGEAVAGLATHMDEEFSKVRAVMATKEELHQSEHRMMDFVDRRAAAIEEKFAHELRRSDDKTERLIVVLEEKHVLTSADAQRVVAG